MEKFIKTAAKVEIESSKKKYNKIQNTTNMKLKHFINIVLIIQIVWILAISETQNVKLLSWTMFFLGITFFARVNHKAIVQFFQEKDPV